MMYFWIILSAGVIYAIWHFGNMSDGFQFGKKKDTPIDILKSRFANGEITEEEYDEKRAVLNEDEF